MCSSYNIVPDECLGDVVGIGGGTFDIGVKNSDNRTPSDDTDSGGNPEAVVYLEDDTGDDDAKEGPNND